jgi:hypothetical protein
MIIYEYSRLQYDMNMHPIHMGIGVTNMIGL